MVWLARSQAAFPPEQLQPVVDWVRTHMSAGNADWEGPDDYGDWDGPLLLYLDSQTELEAIGIDILGRPVGSDAYVQATVMKSVDDAIACLQRQAAVKVTKQTGYQLTRYCVVSKFTHHLRSIPPELCAAAIDKFENAMRGDDSAAWVWQHLELAPAGIEPSELERIKMATQLSHGNGGLALTNLADVNKFAFFCGLNDCLNTDFANHINLAGQMLDKHNTEPGVNRMLKAADDQIANLRAFLGLDLYIAAKTAANTDAQGNVISTAAQPLGYTPAECQRLDYACETIPLNLAEMLDPEIRQTDRFNTTGTGRNRQTFQRRVGIALQEKRASDYSSTILEKTNIGSAAHYRDQTTPITSVWLRAMPGDENLTMSDKEWTARIRHWVAIKDARLQMLRANPYCACGAKFTAHHAENCNHRGHITKRHDRINHLLLEEARETGHFTSWELPIPVRQDGSFGPGRIDGVFTPRTATGKATNFDGTIVSPTTSAIVQENSRVAGAAAKNAERKKNSNGYRHLFDRRNETYMGVALSTSGFQGQGFLALRRRMHKNVPKANQTVFDIDASSMACQSRGLADLNWSVASRFDYYTAVLAIDLQKSMVQQADAAFDASFSRNMPSSAERQQSRASRSPNYNRSNGSTSHTRNAPPASPFAQPTPDIGHEELAALEKGDAVHHFPVGIANPSIILTSIVVTAHNTCVMAHPEHQPLATQIRIPIQDILGIKSKARAPPADASTANPDEWKQATQATTGKTYWWHPGTLNVQWANPFNARKRLADNPTSTSSENADGNTAAPPTSSAGAAVDSTTPSTSTSASDVEMAPRKMAKAKRALTASLDTNHQMSASDLTSKANSHQRGTGSQAGQLGNKLQGSVHEGASGSTGGTNPVDRQPSENFQTDPSSATSHAATAAAAGIDTCDAARNEELIEPLSSTAEMQVTISNDIVSNQPNG